MRKGCYILIWLCGVIVVRHGKVDNLKIRLILDDYRISVCESSNLSGAPFNIGL